LKVKDRQLLEEFNMSWLRSLGRYFSRAKFIGTDLEGNRYFEKVVHIGKRVIS